MVFLIPLHLLLLTIMSNYTTISHKYVKSHPGVGLPRNQFCYLPRAMGRQAKLNTLVIYLAERNPMVFADWYL